MHQVIMMHLTYFLFVLFKNASRQFHLDIMTLYMMEDHDRMNFVNNEYHIVSNYRRNQWTCPNLYSNMLSIWLSDKTRNCRANEYYLRFRPISPVSK